MNSPAMRKPNSPLDFKNWLQGNLNSEQKNKHQYMYCLRGPESLDKIAKTVSGKQITPNEPYCYEKNLDWKALALYNYGTSNSLEINWYLANFNGCKPDITGKYYVFRINDPYAFLWIPLANTVFVSKSGKENIIVIEEPIEITSYNEEKIIVVGSELHDQTIGNKLRFPAQAVRELRINYKSDPFVTIAIFEEGYNPEELTEIFQSARNINSNVKIVKLSNRQQLINYINTRSKNSEFNERSETDKSLKQVLIKKIIFFSHGYPSRLTFKLHLIDSDKDSELNRNHVYSLNPNVFTSDAEIYSYACRTGNDGEIEDLTNYEGKNWKELLKIDQSLAQRLADHLRIPVFAYISRSDLKDTWNGVEGSSYKNKEQFIPDQNIRVQASFETLKHFNEALWNPEGANNGVVAGNTPEGLPRTLIKFNPKERK